MYKNNFDCSSSGLNIEVTAYCSTSYADDIFHDMYTTYYPKRGTNLWVRIYDFDTYNLPTTAGDVGYFSSGRGPISKDIMVEILNEYKEYSYDKDSFTYEELKDELNTIEITYVPDLLHYYGYVYHLNDGVAMYVSKGYCQGDVVNVLCSTETKEKLWQLVDHELWDCPVYAFVRISDCEYNYYDFDGCLQYEWNKQAFVDGVVKVYTNDIGLQERLKKQLNEMLPDELEVL